MNLSEAKLQFINSWGAFGTQWGINRTMAQIYALLLVSAKPLTQDNIMDELAISRGNVNMNIRELIGWGIVEKIIISGERKEHFVAEKDIWKASTQILKERKKRELDPMLKMLEQLEAVEGDKNDKEFAQFTKTIKEVKQLSVSAEKVINVMTSTGGNFFVDKIIKLF